MLSRRAARIAAGTIAVLVPAAVAAQETAAPGAVPRAASITGTVTARGGAAIRGARVTLDSPAADAVTDSAGAYRLGPVTTRTVTLRARALGYLPAVRVATVARETVRVDFELVPRAPRLGPVVTTARRPERFVRPTPVKVDVVRAAFLRRNAGNNVMDAVSFLPGLTQQVDCGVCFTNNIRINGMEGAYTAVLLDGMPVMGALATVYALNGISPALIEQIEIVKGPGSAMHGSDAMAGVIDIITKDPRLAPRFSVDAYATSFGERSVEAAAAPRIGPTSALLGVTAAYNHAFIDRNGDGFTDLPLVRRASVFAKWSAGAPAARVADVAIRVYDENRFGGTRAWTPADRGSSTVYGESIFTRRGELMGSVAPPGLPFRIAFALARHHQDSYYGDQPFIATQQVAFARLLWRHAAGSHSITAGTELRLNDYRDTTRYQATRERDVVPGLFATDEIELGSGWTALAGVRVDRHPAHGSIWSPRLALKWDVGGHTTFRVAGATGFRVVSLFTEDHAALSGAREVRVAERLRPERSVTVTASMSRTIPVRGVDDAATLDIDAYLTRFSNRILPDYDTNPDWIVYRNLRGHAETHGITVAMGYATERQPLFANLGLTFEDVFVVSDGTRREVAFSPRFQGVFTLGYRFGALTLDWTGRVLGPMALPEHPPLPDRSPWFTEQHVQAARTLRAGTELYLAVKNVFGYVQRDAIVGAATPFGDAFDTARVYAPLAGRRVMLGVRHTVPR